MSDAYLLDTNVICARADANHASHVPVRQHFEQVEPQFVLLPTMAMEFGYSPPA